MKIKVGYGATYGRLLKLSVAVFAVFALTSCKEIPNSVHTEKELASNTLYTPFSGRSPKHLDPTSSSLPMRRLTPTVFTNRFTSITS